MEKGANMPKVPYNKRKDGRYYKQIIIGVDNNGKRKVKTLNSKKGESWQEFDKRVREFMLSVDAGKVIEKDITFGECAQMWLNNQVQLSARTMNTYKSYLKRLSRLYTIKLKDLKPVHFHSIYTEMYIENACGLINRIPPIVNSILNFAVENSYLSTNVHQKIKIPKLKLGKRRALTDNEKNAVLKAFDDFSLTQKALVGLLYYTGMRIGEALALKVNDINFERRYINVTRTLTRGEDYKPIEKEGTKTEAGIRKIPIVSELYDILTDYIEMVCRDQEHLFLTRQGNLYGNSSIRRIWSNILSIINSYMPNEEVTKISPHYFRHNFATELVYSNIPMKTAQYILGHEHIAVTMDIYAGVKMDVNNTINLLERYWKNDNSFINS